MGERTSLTCRTIERTSAVDVDEHAWTSMHAAGWQNGAREGERGWWETTTRAVQLWSTHSSMPSRMHV